MIFCLAKLYKVIRKFKGKYNKDFKMNLIKMSKIKNQSQMSKNKLTNRSYKRNKIYQIN